MSATPPCARPTRNTSRGCSGQCSIEPSATAATWQGRFFTSSTATTKRSCVTPMTYGAMRAKASCGERTAAGHCRGRRARAPSSSPALTRPAAPGDRPARRSCTTLHCRSSAKLPILPRRHVAATRLDAPRPPSRAARSSRSDGAGLSGDMALSRCKVGARREEPFYGVSVPGRMSPCRTLHHISSGSICGSTFTDRQS